VAEHRHLGNAPVKEALIDIHVTPPDSLRPEDLEGVHSNFAERYPDKKRVAQGRFGVRIAEGVPETTSVEQDLLGYRFATQDGTRVAQFRRDGFTYSHLDPYENWNALCRGAEEMWAHYVSAAHPREAVRIGTRYINMMRFPITNGDLSDYLEFPPKKPPGQSGSVNNFLNRIVTYDDQLGATEIVTQGLEAYEDDCAPVVLDIDVFVNARFSVEDRELWDRLRGLRSVKNRIFFGGITEKAARCFE